VTPGETAAPRFSIVTAVYNVERFLDAFIASVDAQTFPADRVEVVAVDDGSTDSTPALLAAWAARRPGLVRVISKANGGQATARNLGLDHARGEWVTFTDPDDVIEPDYLAQVDDFLSAHPETGMVAANLLILDDDTGLVSDTHPLNYRFRGPARLRDLDRHPAHFFPSAPVAFFRRSLIESSGLRFDARVRPNFEDAHFTSRYQLGLDRPLVGFVPAARYHYRKRGDATSTLGQSIADPNRYTAVLRHGYLDLLQRASSSTRPVPQWLQNLIIYDLSWLFSVQHRAGSLLSRPEVVDEFDALMSDLRDYLDLSVIDGTPVPRVKRIWREMLAHSWLAEPWCQEYAVLGRLDTRQDLVRVSYRYTRTAPVEQVLSDGVAVRPAYAKVRDHTILGRTVMYERILWAPAGAPLRIRLDGRDVALEMADPARTSLVANPPAMRRRLDHFGAKEKPTVVDGLPPRPGWVVRLACSRWARKKYGDAWLLMDRVHDAGDNGQRLFEYLRAERPEINAWFTVERGTPSWRSLRRKHGRRLLAHGSRRWKLVALNAEHLLSSHADEAVLSPPELAGLPVRPRWRYAFVEHGVIKDDLSSWLNRKPMDLFLTSTTSEQASIAGDHNGYVFTEREAVMTGLPRFDRLREIGSRFTHEQRDLILVAPTWRSWLTNDLEQGSQRRTVTTSFLDSDFAAAWLGLLGSDKLRVLAEEHGVRIGFLPHPNLQAAMADVPLPNHVQRLTFESHDAQELFARAAVLITDYSSMAFNTAYIDRAVVYFQFDRDRVLGGEHVGTGGYFDYFRDGYGPVVEDVSGAVDAIGEVLTGDRTPAPEYQRRIDEAFPVRDGRCCERVTEAVLASVRKVPVSPAED
jgi:glycosyltransferase involved in cell wall biosynthesis